tara:strand:- start:218 stop:598 length:381 start_codon:yes stop_codon:yes gene_type:complete
MRNKSSFIIFTSFFALSLTILNSCTKESSPTVGVVIVVDQQKTPISNARVTLSISDDLVSNQGATPIGELNRTEYTDMQGRVEFTYDLEAIFDINVQKLSGNDTLIGQNMIALVRGETITKQVTVN